MADVLAEIERIRDEEIPPLRAEAGMPEDDDDPPGDEELMRYVEVLEAAVIGKSYALKCAAAIFKGPTVEGVEGPETGRATFVDVIPADAPNVLTAQEAKAIVDCYFNEAPAQDPEPLFTRLGEWADEQLADTRQEESQ